MWQEKDNGTISWVINEYIFYQVALRVGSAAALVLVLALALALVVVVVVVVVVVANPVSPVSQSAQSISQPVSLAIVVTSQASKY